MSNKLLRILIIICALSIIVCNDNTTTTTYKLRKVANDETNNHRDLIMLASLAYENLPRKCSKDSDNYISGNCMFSESDIEGLSQTKLLQMTRIPASGIEDGQKYYYSNMATIEELSGWNIMSSESSESTFKVNNIDYETKFVAYTFNKGKDYVITFRGSDYPDVLEWGQDVSFALRRIESMSGRAEEYAAKIYKRVKETCGNTCSIYITGHSLGGYLAQVAAAKIVGDTYNAGTSKYSIANYHLLKQLVYFNSVGIDAITSVDSTISQIVKARVDHLKQLYSTNLNGKQIRVILYTIKGDAVSSIGNHYGLIRQLKAPANIKRGNSTVVYSNEEQSAQAVDWLSNLYSKLRNVYDNKISNADTVAKMTKQNFRSLKFILDISTNNYSISDFNINGSSNNSLSGLSLIKDNISKSMQEYGFNNIASLLDMTHETDGFMCLVQDGRGAKPNVLIRGDSNYGTHVTDSNTNKSVFYSNGEANIKLSANVTSGCIQTYQWQKCTNEANCQNIAGATNSTYEIDKTLINQNLYYRVIVYYGNSYLERKINKDGSYSYDNVISTSNSSSSDIYEIIYDKEKPKCRFSPTSIEICRGSSASVDIICTDNNGLNYYATELVNISPTINWMTFNFKGPVTNSNKVHVNISTTVVTGLVNQSKTVSLKYIEDYAGNYNVESNNSIEISIKRSLFNSDC